MNNLALSEIAARIASVPAASGMTTKIIGVDGCGGAGKSTFARRLAALLDAQLIQTDDFASWDTALDCAPRLLDQVLLPLHQDRAGRYQRYDWGTQTLAEWHDVPLQPHIVLEGVSSTRAVFRPMLAFKIFVDAPKAIRLTRGLARDGAQALPLWESWQAAEDDYLKTEDPAARADLILDGTQPIPD